MADAPIKPKDELADEFIQIRINKTVKKKANRVLADLGLSLSDAIRLLITKIANEHALPFKVESAQGRPTDRPIEGLEKLRDELRAIKW